MARHIRKDDMVIVTSGGHKGAQGKVLRVIPSDNRVIIEGVNVRTRNLRKSATNPTGGTIRKELPIHFSNVSPAVEVDGKTVPTRVRFETREDGSKVRIAVKTGETLGTPIKSAKAKK